MTRGECRVLPHVLTRGGFLQGIQLNGLLFLLVTMLAVQGCARRPDPLSVQVEQQPVSLPAFEQSATKYTSKSIPKLTQEEPPSQSSVPSEPKFKELPPLDVARISISFVDEGYRQVYQMLARSAGLNLVLDPQLEALLGDRRITAEYQEIQVRSILNAISTILDVAWREEYGTLFIEPYRHETIHLDFLGAVSKSDFGVGGDVLGGSQSGSGNSGSGGDSTNINSPLIGKFEISGGTPDTVTDIYSNIESTVGKRLEKDGEFILNRQTGTLMISGRPRVVGEIKEYLNQLRKKYSQQVLIEAQIIEVNLDKTRNLGIDWRNLALVASEQPLQAAGQALLNVSGDSSGSDAFYNVTLNSQYYTVGSIFRALQQYGNLKILSNPRIKVMNGQSAAISVGQSVSYLKSLTKTTEGTGTDQTTELSTEVSAIFDGILLGVTPIIRDDGSVTLHIVPIKSEIAELDQQQLGDDSSYRLTFPKVNLREISTVVNIKPRDLVVLGGLIMEETSDGEQTVPLLSDVPLLGWLFKAKSTEKHRVEMVIILKADVLKG